jgi:hypothetical protein
MRWLTNLPLKFDDRYATTGISSLEAADGRVPFQHGSDAGSQAAAAYAVDKPYTGKTLQQSLVKVFLNCRDCLG